MPSPSGTCDQIRKLTPDISEAQRFLDALDAGGKFAFQTFADNKASPKRDVARIRHGSLKDHREELIDLQQAGAGVFVTINETDGRGRKEENIKRVRALFVDLDGAPIEPVKEFKLKPHVVIESSPGRWHAYWLVQDFPLSDFKRFQEGLIRKFNADPAVHDLPRVMRLPGFWHLKKQPFQTAIQATGNHLPFSQSDFEAALQDELRPPSKKSLEDGECGTDSLTATAVRLIAHSAETTHHHPNSGRHGELLKLGRALQTSGVPWPVAAEKLQEMCGLFRQTDSDGSPSPLNKEDVLRHIGYAYRKPEDLRPRTRVPVPRNINLSDWTAERYDGSAPERDWLVRGIFPAGAVSVLAAMGDTGKSMMMLDLALEVSGAGRVWGEDFIGAGEISQGTAVLITAEDDQREVHRRLASLRKDRSGTSNPVRLIVVPLPDAGGPLTFFKPGYYGPEATKEFLDICGQLRAITDLKLVVFDPLQAFVALDLNIDPAAAQFVCAELARLASETGAAVIVTHHMRKKSASKKDEEMSPTDAREAVRGSTAIVDGVRCVYALWPSTPTNARGICKALNIEYAANSVVRGAVVKANWPADRSMRTFVRDGSGRLVDQTDKLRGTHPGAVELLKLLPKYIAGAAIAGNPFTKCGQSGVYQRRHEFPELFHGVGRNRFEAMVQELLDDRKLTTGLVKGGGKVRWLDVPGGPVHRGEGEFNTGALQRRGRREK